MPVKQSVSNGPAFWSLERAAFLTTPLSHSFYSCSSFTSYPLLHFPHLYILLHLCLPSIWIKRGGREPLGSTLDHSEPPMWAVWLSSRKLLSCALWSLHHSAQGPSEDTCFIIMATTCLIIRPCPLFSHACRPTDSYGLASWVIWELRGWFVELLT